MPEWKAYLTTHTYFDCCLFPRTVLCSQVQGDRKVPQMKSQLAVCMTGTTRAAMPFFSCSPLLPCAVVGCASALGPGRRLPAIPNQQLCQGGLEDLQSQQLGAGAHPFPPSSCHRMFLIPTVTLAVPEEAQTCNTPAQAGQAPLASGLGWWR